MKVVLAVCVVFATFEAHAAEICGNSLDDDANSLVDEGCYSALVSNQCPTPLGCDDGLVSPRTGSLRYELPPDVAPRVPYGPPLVMRRYLVSQNTPGAAAPAYRKPMGDRFAHGYMSWLDRYTAPNPDQIVLHLPTGQESMFKYTGTVGGFEVFGTMQPGFHFASLKRNTVSGEYELAMLTGEKLIYNSGGRLVQIRDSLATPNVVAITYNNGQISTVTDASGKRRLAFAYAGGTQLISVAFQIHTGSWITQHTTTYGYTAGRLTSVTIGGALAQTNVFDSSGNVTQIQDGEGNNLVSFAYDAVTPGKVVRVDTPRGMVGYEFGSSRATCNGPTKTVLYYHRSGPSTCTSDSDCATGLLCGGKTGAGSTGLCFRAARCLTVASPSEDVVTTVSAFAGNNEPCEGSCLEHTEYIYKTTGGALDLVGIKDPTNHYEVRETNANGLPTKIVYGDTDSDPASGGARVMFLTYDATFPGKLAEARRQSDLAPTGAICSPSNATPCARTIYGYTTDGLLGSAQHTGYTVTPDGGGTVPFTHTTAYDYDARGRVEAIDGPIDGSLDSMFFEYWSTTDLKDGFLRHLKRQLGDERYLTSTALTYDFWGNATTLQDPDGSLTCLQFHAGRGYLAERREAMNGQAACTTHASDLVTSFVRDSALRLTKRTNPDNSCVHYEYDGRGRVLAMKRRDDCIASSAGDTQRFTWSDDGLLLEIETFDAANVVTKRKEMTYFDSRRLEKILNPVSTANWTGYTYEARGLVAAVAAVSGTNNLNKTEWTYNADARVTSEKRYTTASAFDTWSVLFDWFGSQREVEDDRGIATTSTRDDLGRLVKLASPDLGGFPTVRAYDAANRLTTIAERVGGAGQLTHGFYYDAAGRQTSANYEGTCTNEHTGGQAPDIEDIVRVYDALPLRMACPIASGCNHLVGRVAYVKVKLMCGADPGPDGDWTLEQETFFSYDAAGRLIREYIKDETGRTADHAYEWSKAGALTKVTLPSGVVVGWSHGSTASNSDTDRITAMWRTSTATPIADNIRWEPFGPLKQYDQQNAIASKRLKTKIARNLAYRISDIRVTTLDESATHHRVTISEDAAGRVIARDYDPNSFGAQNYSDSYFLYDLQDRVLCETTVLASSCPTTGTSHKNSHVDAPPFTSAGDWKTLRRPIVGTGTHRHVFALVEGTHQIASVDQSETGSYGKTEILHDELGNRASDDNVDTQTNDRRTYSYDSRHNLVDVAGKFYTGTAWHDYNVVSAFDHENRRVFKSFTDTTANKTSTFFFYYDALDRLSEIRHTPDTSVPTTYTVFQLFWLANRAVLYWQTDYPSATTSKRYIGTDESGRPIDMMSWPASGDATRVWAINPSAWGVDRTLVGPNVFQPLLFAGQYKDDETAAWLNSGTTQHRPGLVLNGLRTYDPFTGSYLQVDPLVDAAWSSYVYADSNPVGKVDPRGAMASYQSCTTETTEVSIGDIDGDGTIDHAIEVSEHCQMSPGSPGAGGGGPQPDGGGGGGPSGGGGGNDDDEEEEEEEEEEEGCKPGKNRPLCNSVPKNRPKTPFEKCYECRQMCRSDVEVCDLVVTGIDWPKPIYVGRYECKPVKRTILQWAECLYDSCLEACFKP